MRNYFQQEQSIIFMILKTVDRIPFRLQPLSGNLKFNLFTIYK